MKAVIIGFILVAVGHYMTVQHTINMTCMAN